MSIVPKKRSVKRPKKVPTHRLFIDGKWVASHSGQTFEGVNPATLEVIGRFQQGDKQDARAAIDAAEKAFPVWSGYPAPRRGEVLLKLAELLRKEKEQLARIVTTEMGKPISEGRGDVQEAIDITEYMAGEGRRLFGHTTPSELRDKFCMTVRRPFGVCTLITPWNFPTAIPAWKLMPALICGNSVVFKPSSDTPLCATRMVELCEKAGVPAGVVNMVTGPGGEVGEELIKSIKTRVVSFTGHRSTGKRILELAAPNLKRVGLEMGSKNAIIVMDDADLNLAVDGIIWGGYGTTGQRCTAASRVIVHKAVKEKLIRALLMRIKKLRLGQGLSASTDVGPLVNEPAIQKVHGYTQIGLKQGAKLLCGGKPAKTAGPGFFYEPTLFTNVAPDMRIAQEEIFGPTVSIIEGKNLRELIDICNGVEYGLVNAVYTSSMKAAFNVIEKVDTGLTYINSSTIGSEVHLPFGGSKQSGNTREAGIEGIHEFSETKTVYFDYSGRLQKAQIEAAELKKQEQKRKGQKRKGKK